MALCTTGFIGLPPTAVIPLKYAPFLRQIPKQPLGLKDKRSFYLCRLRAFVKELEMNQQQSALCLAFEAMEREEQMDALQREGVYIGKRKEESGTSLLYQYGSIYVRIVYLVHRLLVAEVNCFTDTAVLDDYFAADEFTPDKPA